VLASGDAGTASPCSNPQLFWALRGGGTFAVVTSMTYRLHHVPATGAVGLAITVGFLQGYKSTVTFLDGLLAVTPGMLSAASTGGVWSGYTGMVSAPQANPGFSGSMVFNGTMAGAKASLGPLYDFLTSYSSDFVIADFSLTQYSSSQEWHDAIDPAATGDRTGSTFTLASRLVPQSVCGDASARLIAAEAIANVSSYVPVSIYMVTGGAVSLQDPSSSLTSVTPAWRTSVWHVVSGVGWAMNATAAQKQEAFTDTTELNSFLRDAFPTSGAYWLEADYNEPSWETSFWGASNYQRLLTLKQQYDPTGVFTCHHCVGDSE